MKFLKVDSKLNESMSNMDKIKAKFPEFFNDDEVITESISSSYMDEYISKHGDSVSYRGHECTIEDVEYDDKYGYDVLIKNPNWKWDTDDARFEYIWIGDPNDDSVKELYENILKESYTVTTTSDILSNFIDNADDKTIDRDLALFEKINKELGVKNAVALVTDDYDPAWFDNCFKTPLATRLKGVEKYMMRDYPIALIHERRNGLNYLYFTDGDNANTYIKAYEEENF